MCSCISKVLATADVYIYVACLHSRVVYGRDATFSGMGVDY